MVLCKICFPRGFIIRLWSLEGLLLGVIEDDHVIQIYHVLNSNVSWIFFHIGYNGGRGIRHPKIEHNPFSGFIFGAKGNFRNNLFLDLGLAVPNVRLILIKNMALLRELKSLSMSNKRRLFLTVNFLSTWYLVTSHRNLSFLATKNTVVPNIEFKSKSGLSLEFFEVFLSVLSLAGVKKTRFSPWDTFFHGNLTLGFIFKR